MAGSAWHCGFHGSSWWHVGIAGGGLVLAGLDGHDEVSDGNLGGTAADGFTGTGLNVSLWSHGTV